MPSNKRVTHMDVARRAGVSPAVVSYVVNNGPRATSPDARTRVLRAIEELDYHPSAFARGLARQETHTIGFVMHDYVPSDLFAAPYTVAILSGLTSALKAKEHYTLIYPLMIDEDLASLGTLLNSGRVDGLVVRPVQESPATDPLMDVIAATRVPCVCIEHAAADRFGFPTLTYDDEGGAYAATRYLIARGHRRIGHLQGDVRYPAACARLNGYRRALTEARLEIDEKLVQGNDWSTADVAQGMRHLLDVADPPTAIFAANDVRAMGAIMALSEHGYRVPEDVAVVGFDDIPLARDMTPPLTTVRIPLVDLGRTAADIILRLIEAGGDVGAVASQTLPVELVHRGTV